MRLNDFVLAGHSHVLSTWSASSLLFHNHVHCPSFPAPSPIFSLAVVQLIGRSNHLLNRRGLPPQQTCSRLHFHPISARLSPPFQRVRLFWRSYQSPQSQVQQYALAVPSFEKRNHQRLFSHTKNILCPPHYAFTWTQVFLQPQTSARREGSRGTSIDPLASNTYKDEYCRSRRRCPP
jgi:hypothetical protein